MYLGADIGIVKIISAYFIHSKKNYKRYSKVLKFDFLLCP